MTFLFSRKLNPKYYFAVLFFLVFQLYCGIYLGLLLLIPILFLIRYALVCNVDILQEKLKDYKWLRKMAKATLINILISLPLLIPYAKRALQLEPALYENIYNTIPTFKSYFFCMRGSLFWDFLGNTANEYPARWDHQIFAGGIAMTCMIISAAMLILKIRRKTFSKQLVHGNFLIAIALSCLITYFYYTRIGTFSFYGLISEIPGFGALRSLTRIVNVELIFFAVAVGFVSNRLLKNHRWYTIPLFILMLGLLIADNYIKEGYLYRTEKSLAQARTEQLMEKMKGIVPGSLVSYEPFKKEDISVFYHLDAMMASLALNLKTVNGYSATSPHGYKYFWSDMTPGTRMKWFRIKRFSPDTIYVVH
jgi:hypothetical protein